MDQETKYLLIDMQTLLQNVQDRLGDIETKLDNLPDIEEIQDCVRESLLIK
jgi:hypothetical protein